MNETPVHCSSVTVTLEGESSDTLSMKTWEEFENCERCHGRAAVDETPNGELSCQLCDCTLPRPSS